MPAALLAVSFGADRRALALMRITAGALLMCDNYYRLQFITAFHGGLGILPLSEHTQSGWDVSLLLSTGENESLP